MSTVTPSELRSPVVLDATVLSNFAYTDDLSLLDALPARVVTVETVISELRAGVEDGYEFLERATSAIDVVDVESEFSDLPTDLDPGETHALHVAREHDGTLATDDLAARGAARTLGMPLTGSVGILVRLVLRDDLTVDEADATLSRWINEVQYHSPVESIREVL